MFVLRSAFRLVVGFLVVAPHGTAFGAAASQVKDQAITAGTQAAEQIIVSQVFGNDPVAGAVVARLSSTVQSAATSHSVALTMQGSSTRTFGDPKPRPAAMGLIQGLRHSPDATPSMRPLAFEPQVRCPVLAASFRASVTTRRT